MSPWTTPRVPNAYRGAELRSRGPRKYLPPGASNRGITHTSRTACPGSRFLVLLPQYPDVVGTRAQVRDDRHRNAGAVGRISQGGSHGFGIKLQYDVYDSVGRSGDAGVTRGWAGG